MPGPDASAFSIERIGAGSADVLGEIGTRTFFDAYADVHASQDLARYCEDNYAADRLAGVLRDESVHAALARNAAGEPAGFFVVHHHPCFLQPTLAASELKQIYVLAAYFGAGLGARLFDEVNAVARAAGSRRLWLCVSDINERARAFYRKQGFERLGEGPVLEVGRDRLPSSVLAIDL